MPKRLTALGFAFRRFAVPGRVGARVFGLNIGSRYSTPVRKRPLHPTRSQFKPEPSQTQARVTPRDRAGATRRWRLNNINRLCTWLRLWEFVARCWHPQASLGDLHSAC